MANKDDWMKNLPKKEDFFNSIKNPEDRKKMKRFSAILKSLNESMRDLGIPEEVLDREIKPFGNASHIILPEKYKGKKAKVIIRK